MREKKRFWLGGWDNTHEQLKQSAKIVRKEQDLGQDEGKILADKNNWYLEVEQNELER